MQPLLIVLALVVTAAAIFVVRFAIKRKQSHAGSQSSHGLSIVAIREDASATVSDKAAKRKDPLTVYEEHKVDESIARFILSS